MATFPDGSLLRDSSTLRVYQVVGGVLHFVPTDAILYALGWPVRPLTPASPAQLAAFPKGSDAQVPEGTLLRDSETLKVYVYSAGALHFVASDAVLGTLGYPQKQLVYVPTHAIAELPLGTDASLGMAAAAGMALARLNDTVPLYVAVSSDFQSEVSNTLGNAGTSSDGFDVLISPAMLGFDGDVAALPELDGHLSAMDYTDGDFRSGNIDPIVADTQPFIDSGDAIINTPAAGPPAADPGGGPAPISNPPAPAPSPVIGGGGGGGGGGEGRGGDPCIEGDEYPFCGPDFPIK